MSVKRRRLRIADAAFAGLHRAPRHYTEGPYRWNAVENPLAWLYGDCSSFVTSCYRRAHEPDPNRERYRAGWTGTLARHGVRVKSPRRGDLIFYGSGWPWRHVAVYVGSGEVISHGSEGGPRKAGLDYRPDRGEIRRYVFPALLRPYYAVRIVAGRLLRA